jgi:hypothetical protein
MSCTSGQMFPDFPPITANYCGTLWFLLLVCLDTSDAGRNYFYNPKYFGILFKKLNIF